MSREEKLKREIETQDAALGKMQATIGQCCEEERPTLTGRVRSMRRRAEGQAVQAAELAELEQLLDENPAVARILELMECMPKY